MKNGFTVLELVLSMAIIMIITSFGIMQFGDMEKRELNRIRIEFNLFIDNAALHCLNSGERSNIVLDFNNKVITAKGPRYNKKYKLPKKLNYFIKDGNKTILDKFEFQLNSTGNANKMFVIYISDKHKKKVLHRIGIYSISVVKYVKIRQFVPKKSPLYLTDDKFYEIEKWKEIQ
ncbi:MAG: type II secretion system protein [Fusobacteria bacterium]|nr:type II secretion system protein [Fusobacteriota bacterium]